MSLGEALYKEIEQLRARVLELERERDSLKERLQIAEEHLEVIAEDLNEATSKLHQYLEMFSCVVCGKPMSWEPNDNLGQALKAFVKEKRYGHSACVNQRKA